MMKIKTLLIIPLILVGCQANTNNSSVINEEPVTEYLNEVPDFNNVYQEVANGIVTIYNCTANGTPLSIGTGFYYKSDNNYHYFMTNNHVVSGASILKVVFDGYESTIADLVGRSEVADVAILKILSTKIPKNITLAQLEFANSDSLNIGEEVFAIGNPLDISLYKSSTKGVISGTKRLMIDSGPFETAYPYIQSSVVLNGGNSGGPLLNSLGKVIGLNTYKYSSNDTLTAHRQSFSLEINYALKVASSLEAKGKFYLKIIGIDVADYRLLSTEVLNKYSASQNINRGMLYFGSYNYEDTAKYFKTGDVITKINDKDIYSANDYRSAIQEATSNRLNIELYRNGNLEKVLVTARTYEG